MQWLRAGTLGSDCWVQAWLLSLPTGCLWENDFHLKGKMGMWVMAPPPQFLMHSVKQEVLRALSGLAQWTEHLPAD